MAKRYNTFKYQFKVGNRIVDGGITLDLVQRESRLREKWPGGRITQVGRKTTEEAARKWEKEKGYT